MGGKHLTSLMLRHLLTCLHYIRVISRECHHILIKLKIKCDVHVEMEYRCEKGHSVSKVRI